MEKEEEMFYMKPTCRLNLEINPTCELAADVFRGTNLSSITRSNDEYTHVLPKAHPSKNESVFVHDVSW